MLLLSTTIRGHAARVLFAITTSAFTTLEIVALYLTGKFIDYRFYNHIDVNAIRGNGFQFLYQGIAGFLFMGALAAFYFYFPRRLRRKRLHMLKIVVPAILLSSTALSMPDGIFREMYGIYEILEADEMSLDDALDKAGIPHEQYVTPDRLEATSGKNIIVIAAESFEKAFMDRKLFGDIMPNMRRFSKEWTFYGDMPVIYGATWTSGSLYAHQVGLPSLFKGNGNQCFQGASDVKLLGLGHILNKAGYDSRYLLGNARYAGTQDILTAYGIKVVSELNAIGKYPPVKNGLNDLDLFDEAKLQIADMRKGGKPFALFLSTINTHFPNGIYDARMERYIKPKRNNVEFSVAALDYLVNDLVDYLKKENLLDNTVIYIFPDHPFMGSSGEVISRLNKTDRSLYLLTNADKSKFPKDTNDTLYQTDLPRFIINGAGIKTNGKFWCDFLGKTDVREKMKGLVPTLTALNTASVARKSFQGGIRIATDSEKITLASDEDSKLIPILSRNGIYDIKFDQYMVYLEHKEIDITRALNASDADRTRHNLHLILTLENGKITQTYFGNKWNVGLYKEGMNPVYKGDEIATIQDSNNKASQMDKERIKFEKGQGDGAK